MKNFKRVLAVVTLIAIMLCSFTTVFAKNDYALYQNSIIMIASEVQFTGSNTNLTFTRTATGTGFAVGLPGKPVQYIATSNHVVNEPEGIYQVFANPDTGEILNFAKQEDGTETRNEITVIDGIEYIVCVDYFKTKPTKIIALYSGSTNDYVSLTVAQVDESADVAICKLASEPTSKIEAMPLQFKDKVNPNTDVVAVGFPGMSSEINKELRLDGSDSTIKDGRVGKKQRVASLFDDKVMIDTYQLTAATAQGMSGGPVISEETNAVIGVVAFSYLDSSQLKTDDYAVCVDYLKPLLEREGIPYKVQGEGISIGIIAAIIAAILIIGLIVILIVVLGKKKSADINGGGTNGGNGQIDINPSPYTTPINNKKYLICLSGSMAGKKYSVTSKAIIGRDKNKCNVVYPVDQPGVSAVHCELRFENNMFMLKDCDSSYGTFLSNGTKLEPNVAVPFTNGSKFWVGTKENLFEVKY